MAGEIVIGGIGTAVVVTFVVQLLKAVGVVKDGQAGNWALLLNVGFYVLWTATQVYPAIEPTVIGVLKVVVFIAVTFGGSLVTYTGLKTAQIRGFTPKLLKTFKE